MNKDKEFFEQVSDKTDVLSRPTKAIINLDIYKENLLSIKSKVHKKIMAIVKADAYGHGSIPISKAAEEIVDFFGVATLEEGLAIRQANIKKPILVLGFIEPAFLPTILLKKIRVTIFSKNQWENWKRELNNKHLEGELLVHLKINSGMNRLGFKNINELNEVITDIRKTKDVEIEGIFTHFATADSPNDKLIKIQEENFSNMTEHLMNENYIFHIANSAYTLTRKSGLKFDMVRLGIPSYGLLPDPSLKNKLSVETRPILELKTKIIHIQHLNSGDKVGYGGTYQAKKDEKIGIIPIGYADGLLRRYSDKGYVLINNEKRKIIGRICMDQTMLLLNEKDEVEDEVVIYGKQGDFEITIEQAAEWSDTINYEITCSISPRVFKKYINKN